MNAVDQIIKKHRKAENDLRLRIAKFIEDQSADNVHGIRTSARRMEAIFDLLPKSMRRKGKSKKYLRVLRKFFRSTAEIRDLDVVRQNLESYSSSPGAAKAIQVVMRERRNLLSGSLQLGRTLRKAKSPRIRKKGLSAKKLLNRRDKILGNLKTKLQEELPIVLADYRKIRELHDMRKECKKLRYTLELLPTKEDSELAASMRNWQAVLGTIRDIDVTEQFAEKKGLLKELEEVLTSLRISRSRMLESFGKSAKHELYTVPTDRS